MRFDDKTSLLRFIIPSLLFLYSGWLFSPYLRDGLPLFFDAHSHLTRNWFAMEAIRQWSYPGWSNYWYGGYRFAEFYGPLYYWINGALGAITGDIVFSTKFLLWLGQSLCVMGMYFCLRSFGVSITVALTGALLYLKMPVFDWIIGTIGNHPSIAILLCIPPVVGASFSYFSLPDADSVKKHRKNNVIACSLMLSAALSAHFFNAVMSVLGVVVFQLGVILGSGMTKSAVKEKIKSFLAVYLCTAIFTAYVWLPFILDIDIVSLRLSVIDPPRTHFSITPLMRIAGLTEYRWEYVFLRSHGTFLVVAALCACALGLLHRFRTLRPGAIAFLTSLALVTLASDRCALVLPIFLLITLCIALEKTGEILSEKTRIGGTMSVCLIFLALAFFSSGNLGKGSFPRYEQTDVLDDYLTIGASDEPGQKTSRTFDLTKTSISVEGFYGWSSFSPAISGKSIPFGAFPQASSLGTNITMATLSVWVPLTNGKDQSQRIHWLNAAVDALFLNNIGFLIKRDSATAFSDLDLSRYGETVNDHVFKLQKSSPIIFSQNAEQINADSTTAVILQNPLLELLRKLWVSDPFTKAVVVDSSMRPVARTKHKRDWEKLLPHINNMGLNRDALTAKTFFITRGELKCDIGTKHLQPEFKLTRFTESIQAVSIEAESNVEGCARVSYAYDPHLIVRMDGQRIDHYEDALGQAIVIRFPKGKHLITIDAPSDWLRKSLTILSAVLALLCIIYLVFGSPRPALFSRR